MKFQAKKQKTSNKDTKAQRKTKKDNKIKSLTTNFTDFSN